MRKLLKRIVPEIPDHQFLVGDCLELMRQMPDNSVDLVLCSPPYEDARLYGELNFKVKGQDWVDWAKERYLECVRVSKGLVVWVVEGKTRKFQWSATPALLMADLHRAGVKLRKPGLYVREGIPGSGGPDWLKNKYEWMICSSKGRLPWADPTACGHPPKCGPGGPCSYRDQNGERLFNKQTRRAANGERDPYEPSRPMPTLANPGNIIVDDSPEYGNLVVDCGANTHFGHKLAHESEAPFPEKLAEFCILSFCPEGGIVLDPFSGSGTTVCVAKKYGRKGIGIDLRQDQIDISLKRIADPVYERKVS
jgi:hypothetical protein